MQNKRAVIALTIGVGVLTWILISWAPKLNSNGSTDSGSVAVLNCEIVNEDESLPFVTSAELYLSVKSSRLPGLTYIYPLNVGLNKGKRMSPAIETPFVHVPLSRETLTFELLDDDGLSDEEAELLSKSLAAGSKVILYAGDIYLVSQGISLPSGAVQSADALLQMGAKKYSESKVSDDFESLCLIYYEVPEIPPGTKGDANQMKMVEKTLIRDIERLRIHVHYQKSRFGDIQP